MNTVKWTIKVKRQEKTAKGNVLIKALLSGKKREDGNYDAPIWLDVIVMTSGDKATEWEPQDLTDKWIVVEGNFTHSDWEAKGKAGKNYTIFASSIVEINNDDFITTDESDDIPFIPDGKPKAKKKSSKNY